MVLPLGKPRLIHLHLVIRHKLPGAFLVAIARVGPGGGTDELVAAKEEVIALSVGIARSPHTHILHQTKVTNLGEQGRGRGGRGRGGRDKEGEGKKGKRGGERQGRGGEKGEVGRERQGRGGEEGEEGRERQ